MEYLDLIVLSVLIVVVAIFFRSFKTFVHLLGICEVFLRIMRYIANNINYTKISLLIKNKLPASLFSIIDKYSNGVINDMLKWLLLIIFIIWLFYLIKTLFKSKK